MLNEILSFIFGIAITIYIYEFYKKIKEEKIQALVPRKLEQLLEESSMRIGERQKLLNRNLTEEEKDSILDKCYREL